MTTQTLRTDDSLPDLEVEAIADFIANMHDLPVEDLLSDFCTTMLASFPTLDREFLEHVYNSFMSIGPETRFDLKFNHRDFVRNAFRSFEHKKEQMNK